MLKALIGALLGALIFSSSPAIAENWMPITESINGEVTIYGDSTSVKLVHVADDQLAAVGHFKQTTKKINQTFYAGVFVSECLNHDNGELMIHGDAAGSEVTKATWKTSGDTGNDIIGTTLCAVGTQLLKMHAPDPKDSQ